jgi:hypothetical protein
MTSLSDTLTVGLVLVLLFGSIALYLYTRIQQAEQKISLLESILLDLKMSSEIKSYTELPADEYVPKIFSSTERNDGNYIPFDDEDHTNTSDDDVYPGAVIDASGVTLRNSKPSSPSLSVSSKDEADETDVEQYKSVIADAVKDETSTESVTVPSASKVSVNYESMTIKELQTLAKTRGISGSSSMKKGAIIDALKVIDRSSSIVEPGSGGLSSFLETSSPFQGSESQ